jgi:hypothetical protein
MERREKSCFDSGLAGARSRDLRIKRPDNQGARKPCFSELPCTIAGYTQPTVNQLFEKAGVCRPLWASFDERDMDHGHHHGGAE